MDGQLHGRRQKYIPRTSSVDNKQVKSNGNIGLKKKTEKKTLIQQIIKNQNNLISMSSIIAYNEMFII